MERKAILMQQERAVSFSFPAASKYFVRYLLAEGVLGKLNTWHRYKRTKILAGLILLCILAWLLTDSRYSKNQKIFQLNIIIIIVYHKILKPPISSVTLRSSYSA